MANSPYLPMVYALMTSKSEEYYRTLFQELYEMASESSHELNPTLVICDYELSAINALKSEFLNVKVQGCFFHLGQSIFEKIQDLGLDSRYNHEEELSLNLRKLQALSFLPPNEIPEAFDTVCE